ncbi:MAG: phosphatase PAP2 family protein [Candidatus Cloacimonetes bacterium]|jgi:membrane-associated PAP2 superfamily phosphatase|nr:phosphatase PAP2 family protein [Candidatus Cloacimonadota bacterium]NLO44271.1 phosphatase PAP2 family protein [Candidatus Cloacimonadota bacterium]
MNNQNQAQSLNNDNNSIEEMAPYNGRHFLLKRGFWLPVLIMALTAVIFNIFLLDIYTQARYYSEGWRLATNTTIVFIYKYSNIPALITVLGSLLLLALSYIRSYSLIKYRKLFIYLVIVMIVGPGLVINTALKDNWGRPRPRDIQEFGGKHAYEAPLRMNRDSPGKSFPCGHASMGFYFFAFAHVLGIFSLRRYHFTNIISMLFGSTIGWVRIVQGGHFLSDVIFSGALVFLVAHIIWHLMKLDRNPFCIPKESDKQLSVKHLVIIGSVAVLFLAGLGVATPYQKEQDIKFKTDIYDNLKINLINTSLTISLSDSIHVSGTNRGFGFPGSKSKLKYKEIDGVHHIEQEMKGFFSELQSNTIITIDSLRVKNFHLSIDKGEINFMLNANWTMNKDVDVGQYHLSNDSGDQSYIFEIKDAEFKLN